MDYSTHATGLRYLDADDVDDAIVDFDGLDVYAADGQKVGDIAGFIIDPAAHRVNYVVVDSGGWFTSRRFLLPIGHAALAPDRKSLQTDITHDALRRLPPFDDSRFHELTDEELFAFERDTAVVCCPDEPLETVSTRTSGDHLRRHFQQPEWWSSAAYAPERLRPVDRAAFAARTARPAPGTTPRMNVRDEHNRELVTARDSERSADDVSPHPEERAQPGDVLGIETGGERTGIGDTAADEDKRRRTAEHAAVKDRTEEQR
jgi:hypothetical protein